MIRKIVRLTLQYFNIGWQRFRIWLLSTSNSIEIGKGNYIHPRVIITCKFGGQILIGDRNEFLQDVSLMTYGGRIKIGSRCSINPGTIIYGHGEGVEIGDDVLIAAHTVIIPSNHGFARIDIPFSHQAPTSKGIRIGNNVWIGAGVQILDGVTIGSGSIIAAGAVVNRSVESNSIVGGVPARLLRVRK